jgi:hypothetical protein
MATQVTNNLMLSGYYSLEFQEYRLPELGSYFSPAEILTDDSEFFLLKPGVPGVAPRVGLAKVSDETTDTGEFGLNAQYYIENLDLEVGAYYLNYHDKISHGLTGAIDFAKGAGLAPPDVLAADAVGLGEFKWVYKEDVDLFAISLAKEIAGLSVGMDIVRRENAPLPPDLGASINRLSGVPAGLPIPDYDFDAADGSHYPGPVGDTWHVVVNALGLLNANSIWDGGSYAAEVTVSWLDEVTENEEFLASNVHEGRAVTGVGLLFKPQWFQVLPGTDLTLPMSVSYTIDGEAAPIGNGGNEELGNFSVGAELLVDQAWTASLKYNGFFGPAANGLGGLLKDRDNVSFTIKRTF